MHLVGYIKYISSLMIEATGYFTNLRFFISNMRYYLLENPTVINTFTAIVDLSRSNFSIARPPLFQLKSAT